MSAVLSGQWVVASSWLRASSAAAGWVAEEEHEVHGDNSSISAVSGLGAGGPRRGRLHLEGGGPRLFDGLHFHLHGPFNKPSRKDLLSLLREGGGTAAADKWPDSRGAAADPLVLYGDLPDDELEPLQSRCAESGLGPPAHANWVFESISRHECLPRPGVAEVPSQESEVY
mmetsp:Transcript_10175/g.33616  ORF Transcript_10175/g.33616 Transcript_10175/m.33616 type:complete len:171 (-) Transcript_10175:91-603(-)